jgi:hypothetical protein
MWTCPKCGAKVDPSFEVCWRCGTSGDGTEDPNFVCADDYPPIDDPIAEPVPEISDREVEVIVHAPPTEMAVAYWASDHIEATFLADQLSEQEILAIWDTHDRIPELVSGFPNARVWVRVEDLPLARAWLEEYDHHHKDGRHRSSAPINLADRGGNVGPAVQGKATPTALDQ